MSHCADSVQAFSTPPAPGPVCPSSQALDLFLSRLSAIGSLQLFYGTTPLPPYFTPILSLRHRISLLHHILQAFLSPCNLDTLHFPRSDGPLALRRGEGLRIWNLILAICHLACPRAPWNDLGAGRNMRCQICDWNGRVEGLMVPGHFPAVECQIARRRPGDGRRRRGLDYGSPSSRDGDEVVMG